MGNHQRLKLKPRQINKDGRGFSKPEVVYLSYNNLC